ncbi:MAG: hypothetical protein A2W00_04900 [Candidatus Eisenbacteria bacterium RBG_16_71_46]|nr:MAG: hypothetical protein A2W00_04900 [Candidatus Eisenbacteria bacterium RBG_16_71_46]
MHLPMELIPIDDHERLFIGTAITDWGPIEATGIRLVIDLEDGLDGGVPTAPDRILYVYFPMRDAELPNPASLRHTAAFAAAMYRSDHKVLVHCEMGYNRSALMGGLILHELGWAGADAVTRLVERRPGALFNEVFRAYLLGLPRAIGTEGLPEPR